MAASMLTVAILAGGAATRLGGRDKGLEPLGGRPLIAWVLAAIAPQVDRVLIIANRSVERYSRYAPTIADITPGFHGPLAGIAAALSTSETAWLLTVPVDCPSPPVNLADRLIAGALESDANCVTVHDGENRQPLFALYRRELAASAADGVAAEWGVWQWQDSIGARELDFSDQRRQFQNLNTPEDFTRYAKPPLAC